MDALLQQSEASFGDWHAQPDRLRTITQRGRTSRIAPVHFSGGTSNQPPPQDTTVVFDGETYAIHAPVNCAMAGNGRLGIGASTERGKKLIAVSLTRDPPLVVYSVGFRHFNVRGYTNNSNEVFATKVDNTYRISGRMPPEEGEKEGHRFEFEVNCPKITEYAPEYRDRTRIPRPPRPHF